MKKRYSGLLLIIGMFAQNIFALGESAVVGEEAELRRSPYNEATSQSPVASGIATQPRHLNKIVYHREAPTKQALLTTEELEHIDTRPRAGAVSTIPEKIGLERNKQIIEDQKKWRTFVNLKMSGKKTSPAWGDLAKWAKEFRSQHPAVTNERILQHVTQNPERAPKKNIRRRFSETELSNWVHQPKNFQRERTPSAPK